MLFFFIIRTLSAPTDTGDNPPPEYERTPGPTAAPTRSQYEVDRGDVVVPEEPKTEDNLLIAFIVLVCVFVIGAVSAIGYFVLYRKNRGQVGAADQNDPSSQEKTTQQTTRTATTPTTPRPGTSHTIYSVNTVVL